MVRSWYPEKGNRSVGEVVVSGFRHDVDVVKRIEAARVVLTVGGKGNVYQIRIDLVKRFEIDFEALRDAGAIVFDEHVGFLGQFVEALECFRVLQVERDAFLVAIERVVVIAFAVDLRVFPSYEVSRLGVFHLDHLGAEVGEVKAGVRTQEITREVDNEKVFERLVHEKGSFAGIRARGSKPPFGRRSRGVRLRGS